MYYPAKFLTKRSRLMIILRNTGKKYKNAEYVIDYEIRITK